jgi:PPE-repeat protein
VTAPIWIAAPPEVHSTLLSSGPGAGPLLQAAGAWSSLSAEYTDVADELTDLLAQVQAGAWQGPSAESFVAANAPFLAWLNQAGANSAAAAAQHETLAAAHTAALAAMPTLPELATNHVVHGALVGTNFFGINTIPIALNEADYARMWIQAATTMGTYQAVAGSAVAATPVTEPAPPILKVDSQTNSTASPADATETSLDQLIVQFLQARGITWDPTAGTINGLPYSSYTNPLTTLYWVKNTVTLVQDLENFAQLLATNPEAALASLTPANIIAFFVAHPVVAAAIAASSATTVLPAAAAAAVASVAAVVGLIDPSLFQPFVPALPPIAALPIAPMVASTPLAAATVAPTAPTPSAPAAPAASTATGTAPAPPSPPPAGVHGLAMPYAFFAGGGPPIGFGSGARAGASSSARLKAPAESGAVAAAGAARRRSRKRRTQQAHKHDYADATLDYEIDPEWESPPQAGPVASDSGAGSLGFAGTVTKSSDQATGLATLDSDDFGGGPSVPMLPHTWTPEEGRDN